MRITAFASPRDAIAHHTASRQGETFAALSRLIGRPDGFLARFVGDGVRSRLQPDERALLARFLGCDERDLGAPNVPHSPVPRSPKKRFDWYDARA